MLNGVGIPGLIVVGLIILFIISFILFIRKILLNSYRANRSNMNMEARLQQIEDKLDSLSLKVDNQD